MSSNSRESHVWVLRANFSRLIENIRSRDDPSANIGMTKDWDFNIEEKDAEFRDDLREASGVGRRRKKVPTHPTSFWRSLIAFILERPPNRTTFISTSSISHWGWKPSIRRQRPSRGHPYHARSHSYRAPRSFCLGRSRTMLRRHG